jgi:alkylated DNA repair dioxygenase AlkB
MPDCFRVLARRAAKDAGYPDFVPDACLINRYEPGARLTLHQDKNERDYAQPIVFVPLGLGGHLPVRQVRTQRSHAEIHDPARRCGSVG